MIICLEQFKNLCGYRSLPSYPDLPPPLAVAKGLVMEWKKIEPLSVAIGCVLMLFLEACNRVKAYAKSRVKDDPRMEYLKRVTEMKEIFATIFGASVGYLTSATAEDGSLQPIVLVVGHIQPGLPPFHYPWDIPVFWEQVWTDSHLFVRLVIGAFLCALSSFVTTFATAKKMAIKFNYPLDAGQEMIGLGSAGLAGSFFGAFPPSGSLSRTGLAADCGVKTQMGGLISAAIIGIGLQFLTPMLFFLPKATLAAIIMTSTRSLVDFSEPQKLWKFWKPADKGGLKTDLVVWCTAFCITSMIGVLQGILAAVCVSLVMIVADAAAPPTAILGRLDNGLWRNRKDWKQAKSDPGIMVYEFRGPLLFSCAEYFQEDIEQARVKNSTPANPVKIVILSLQSVHRVDATALAMMEDVLKEWKEKGISCIVSGAKAQTRRLVEQRLGNDGAKLLKQQHYLIGINDAYKQAKKMLEEEYGVDNVQRNRDDMAKKIQSLFRKKTLEDTQAKVERRASWHSGPTHRTATV